MSGARLSVSFNMTRRSRTNSSAIAGFNLGTEKVVPAVFERFPQARSNSADINWKNIDYNNVPKLADKFWAHPLLLPQG
jgi:hypothetical protein